MTRYRDQGLEIGDLGVGLTMGSLSNHDRPRHFIREIRG
jgi:hypothetical protein